MFVREWIIGSIERAGYLAFLLALVMLPDKTLEAQAISPFADGERIVFTGNSITDGGHYHSYIWLYYMTRFPEEKIYIYNAGIGGDTSKDIFARLEHDVFSKNPTTIVLTFGMNDVGYYEFLKANTGQLVHEKIQHSREYFQLIEDRLLKETGRRVILLSSSPYDEQVRLESQVFPGKNDAILEIAAVLEESAGKNLWGYIDLNGPMSAINQKMQKTDPAFTLCGADRIHPDNLGHMVMAWLFLKAQGLGQEKLAAMHVDAGSKQIILEDKCRVSNLSYLENGLSFDYLAHSLPYPLDTVSTEGKSTGSQADVSALIPVYETFNREILQVSGLEKGDYMVKIDEILIGRWSDEALAAGINLAKITTTPQHQQALSIMHLNEERWEIERRLRSYYWMQFSFFNHKGLLFADNQTALDTLDKYLEDNVFLRWNRPVYAKAMFPEIRETWDRQMDLLLERIYTINKPRIHTVQIIKT